MFGVDDSRVGKIAIESGGEHFSGDVVGSDLDDVTITGPPTVVDAFPLTERTYAVIIEAGADALYELEVSTVGFWRQPERIPADVRLSADERSAYFSGFANVRALFDARYDLDTDTLQGISLMGIVDA